MRIIMSFSAENQRLPEDYRPFVMSYFKGALQREYPEVFNEFYGKDSVRAKAFCFCFYIRGMKKDNGFLISPSKSFQVIMSCADYWIMNYFYNSLIKSRGRIMQVDGGNRIKLVSINMKFCKDLKGETAHIKFLSPMLVRKHIKEGNKDYYLAFDSPDFLQTLDQNISLLSQQFDIPYTKFSFRPIKPYAAPVRNMQMNFLANFGEYQLTTDNQLLNFLYKSGIGSRRGEGFGMFEVRDE